MAVLFFALCLVSILLVLVFLFSSDAQDTIIDWLAGVDPYEEQTAKWGFVAIVTCSAITFAVVGVIVLSGNTGPVVVRGEVVSKETGKPIIECRVSVGTTETLTSQDGTFELRLALPDVDENDLKLIHEEYESLSMPASELARTPGQRIEMTRKGGQNELREVAARYSTMIVSAETGKPIKGATIRIGNEEDTSGDDGKVDLQLPNAPKDEDCLRISHDDYISSVFRFDNMSARKEIRLKPKYRVIVVEFDEPGKLLTQAIRQAAESQLTDCREIELLAEANRNEVVEQLFRYQEGHALYEKETLVKVGDFLGGTHGVFGSITTLPSGNMQLDCSFIELRTAKKVAGAQIRVMSEAAAAEGTELLIDQLLADLAEVKILTPLQGERVSRKISVSGYALFLPASWKLCVTVMPLDNNRHYPQMPLTVENDGSWTSPGVQIGKDESARPPEGDPDFAIYPVLCSPEGSGQIIAYRQELEAAPDNNTGLDIGSWGTDLCKIFRRIVVIPPGRE